MTSKIKVDNINKVSDDSNIINKCGTTVTVGASGNTVTVTGNDIRSDNYKAADGGVIISQSGTAITIGASGDTVSLASGASQSGFGRSGSVNWQTGDIKTGNFTAASGEGYFINSSSSITMNLPAGSAGAIVAVSDYARNFNTHNFVISPNGSEKIGGVAATLTLDVDGQATTLVYVDSTKGWINVQNAEDTQAGLPPYMCASGGTVSQDGNFRVHTFTSPGTFVVNRLATASPAPGFNSVSHVVVAGGGGNYGGPGIGGGGGGAGGYRESKGPEDSYTASPLASTGGTTVTLSPGSYPITIGAAGGARANGSPTSGFCVTSAGGGYGGLRSQPVNPGGSGGGGGDFGTGNGAPGNNPSTSPPQGNPGFAGSSGEAAGGGGGAGSGGPVSTQSSNPGSGTPTSITGTAITHAAGGDGECGSSSSAPIRNAGGHGMGSGGTFPGSPTPNCSAKGGVVIVRYRSQ